MKHRYPLALLCYFFLSFAYGQTLISTTLLGSKTKAQLVAQYQLSFIQYGAKYYRITYTSPDAHGITDTLSGLVVIPDDASKVYPRLVYQHGTVTSKLDVPSFNILQNGEGRLGLLFAGLGYVSLLPDYLGLGVSKGFHPYVHAATEASAAANMLRALPAFAAAQGVHLNDQLFITGYSQGGHASMALHREVETSLSGEFTATAAAHLSGPYSISGVMRDLILSDKVYFYPAYLPNTLLSYQTVYGNLYNQLTDVVKEPYASTIQQYYNGTINLDQLNNQLISQLTANEGSSKPLQMLQPNAVQQATNNPDYPFNVALRDNDVYAWAPKVPTRIFYCQADDQVPYQNSIVARDTMTARGAASLLVQDVSPGSNHGACVTPALTSTLFFFAAYQMVQTYVATGAPAPLPLALFPNPANSEITLLLPSDGAVFLRDLSGRLQFQQQATAGQFGLDVSGLNNGLYLVEFLSEGKVRQGKVVVQH